MPLWRDLGASVAKHVTNFPPDEGSPLEAISAYEHEFGRVRLIDELRSLLHHGTARPGDAHRQFCRLPFDVVCTTNVDCLLERGYDAVSRDYLVVVEEDQLSLGVDARAATLLKLHGDLNHPHRLVVSESDYDRFIVANPLLVTDLSNLLITRTALFIGYSLEDPDFRQMLAVVTERLRPSSSPAVHPHVPGEGARADSI
jgi:SIR2-like protein